MKRIIKQSIILTTSLLLTFSLTNLVYANENANNTNEINQDITGSGMIANDEGIKASKQASSDVLANVDSNFTVSIPKNIELLKNEDTGNFEASLAIKVSGDISSDKALSVLPSHNNFTLSTASGKTAICRVISDNTEFNHWDLTEDTESEVTHLLKASLSGGDWTGELAININLKDDLHEHLYVDGFCECGAEDPALPFALSSANYTMTGLKSLEGDVVIPATFEYEGQLYRVTAIGDYELDEDGNKYSPSGAEGNMFENATSVVIPEGVTKIGYGAMASTKLTSVEVPSTLRHISDGAFILCVNLESINLPEGLTYIGDQAFAWSGLKSLHIPSTVEYIGQDMLDLCQDLEYLTVSDLNTKYSDGDGNNVIIEKETNHLINASGYAVIPDYVKVISRGAFSCTSKTDEIFIPDSIEIIESHAFSYTTARYITGCNGLKEINDNAFTYITFTSSFKDTNETVESITLPNEIEYVGDNSLGKVANVYYYGGLDISNCGARTINGYIDNQHIVYTDETMTTVSACSSSLTGSIILPDTVKTIEDDFSIGSKISNIYVPNTVEYIGSDSFNSINTLIYNGDLDNHEDDCSGTSSCGCSYWGAMNCISSATIEGDWVFEDTEKTILLAYSGDKVNREVPDGVTVLRFGSLGNMRGTVYIPSSVVSIEADPYNGIAIDATSIDISEENTQFASINGMLCTKDKQTLLEVPSFYEPDILEIPDSIVTISKRAGQSLSIDKVIIPASVKYIEEYAFSYSSLSEIDFSDGLISIGNNAFSWCKLQNLILPNSLQKIGNFAFNVNQDLQNITFGSGIKTIGRGILGLTAITEVEVPSTITSVDALAFNEGMHLIYNGPLNPYNAEIQRYWGAGTWN